MAKKKTKNIFSEEDHEKQAIEFLRSRGYGVFKIGGMSDREEAEAVKRLQAIGYKVEHINNALVKIDTNQISSVDDIAIYFHEMLRRYNRAHFDKSKLSNKESRVIDRSILNHLVNWRVENGEVSLQQAISELFIMIDILFEKAPSWGIDVRGIGILSIIRNKAFVMSLFREVRLKQDADLRFRVDRQIDNENKNSYLNLLDQSKKNMNSIKGSIPKGRRKIK